MGGWAGIIVKGQKARVVVEYGLIAMGFVAMVVGLNYAIGTYGTEPSLIHGLPVIAAGALAIAIGMLREMVVGSNHGSTEIWNVLSIGVTRSFGIALGIVGSMYVATQNLPGQAMILLALGVVCLVGE